jgi:metal-dependent amidase/aminoacylase/carboxypeptidase family protein
MSKITAIVDSHRPELTPYIDLYKHFHTHPELSFQEVETASKIHSELSKLGSYEVSPDIGGTGLAAVFKNGDGKTVLLRADIDALPVAEKTGLEYASTKVMKDLEGVEKGVMHVRIFQYFPHHVRVKANKICRRVVTMSTSLVY